MINSLPHNPDLVKDRNKGAYENIMGKGENAGYLFQQCFLPFTKQISNFQSRFF